MIQSIYNFKERFLGSEIIIGRSFKTVSLRDNSALLAREDRQLSQDCSILRDKSVHFYKHDCFECQSPDKKAA